MEIMEEDNPVEGEFVTTLTMELKEEEGQRQEGPKVEETVGPIEEAVEDAPQSSFSASIPRGMRVTHSPRRGEKEEVVIPVALNLLQRPKTYKLEATQVVGVLEQERRREIIEAVEARGIPTYIAVREFLASTLPVVVCVHEEEIIVGEEEGPSETVPTTEPTIQPGEGVVEHEEQAGKENTLVNTA